MRNLILVCLIAVFTFGCDTDIPETDTTPPEFSLRIMSARFDRTFTQDDDLENMTLRLKHDSGYQFTFIGTDLDGLRYARWRVPYNDVISFDTDIPSPWSITNIPTLYRNIEWIGDRDNPLTGAVITGKFRAIGNNRTDDFRILVSDFGGDSANYNNTSMNLEIAIGNWEAEVVERN